MTSGLCRRKAAPWRKARGEDPPSLDPAPGGQAMAESRVPSTPPDGVAGHSTSQLTIDLCGSASDADAADRLGSRRLTVDVLLSFGLDSRKFGRQAIPAAGGGS